ncbi:hypothetical protein HK405_001023, partial [Cladochytrium tenue]
MATATAAAAAATPITNSSTAVAATVAASESPAQQQQQLAAALAGAGLARFETAFRAFGLDSVASLAQLSLPDFAAFGVSAPDDCRRQRALDDGAVLTGYGDGRKGEER